MRNCILIACLFFLFGCKKESTGEVDNQTPLIMLSSPANNQVFRSGDQISISATITDNNRLEEIHLEITNMTTGAFITHEHYAPEGARYELNKSFAAFSAATYRIKVEAQDQKGNKAQSQVNVSIN